MAELPPILRGEETYLGDGLYASFDGFQFKLRAPRHPPSPLRSTDHEVYLEPSVLDTFQGFVERVYATIKTYGAREDGHG